MKNQRPLMLAVSAAIIFQHFTLLEVANFPVTLGFLVATVIVVRGFNGQRAGQVMLAMTFVIAWLAATALFSIRVATPDQYFSSFALALIATFFYAAGYHGTPYNSRQVEAISRGIFFALCAISAVSVAQVATGAAGSESLFNLWGDRQYQYKYDPTLAYYDIPRAQGFFLEPSYNAFVIGSCAVALIVLGFRRAAVAAIAIVGLLASQSATGMIIAGAILLLTALKASVRVRVLVITVSVPLVLLSLGGLAARIASISEVGSSGNYRVLAPLPIIADILENHPLGLPLGSIYDVVPTYGLVMNGVAEAVSIDTGHYVLIYYLGWLGVALLLIGGVWVARDFFAPESNVDSWVWMASFWVFTALVFTGAIIAPEFAFMIWIVLIARRHAPKSLEKGKALHGRVIRRRRDLSRYRRTSTHAR